MTIGNEVDARRALRGDLPFLGEGYTRSVYLSGNVVYKVNECMDEDCNESEDFVINKFRNKEHPFNLKFPLHRLFNIDGQNVMAMEYIDGTALGECFCTPNEECSDTCLPNEIVDYVAGELDIPDAVGYGNLMMRDSDLYIIDAAY